MALELRPHLGADEDDLIGGPEHPAPEAAVDAAISLVSESIERTVVRGTPRRNGVDFEGALPSYIKRVSALCGE